MDRKGQELGRRPAGAGVSHPGGTGQNLRPTEVWKAALLCELMLGKGHVYPHAPPLTLNDPPHKMVVLTPVSEPAQSPRLVTSPEAASQSLEKEVMETPCSKNRKEQTERRVPVTLGAVPLERWPSPGPGLY